MHRGVVSVAAVCLLVMARGRQNAPDDRPMPEITARWSPPATHHSHRGVDTVMHFMQGMGKVTHNRWTAMRSKSHACHHASGCVRDVAPQRPGCEARRPGRPKTDKYACTGLSLIHISEPTRLGMIS